MNGNIGFYDLKPDQMQVINPLLILTFIPLYELIFYPFLSLIGIRRPLQKLTLGGIFAGVAFLLSAFVEISIAPTYAVIAGKGEGQVRIFNNRPCDYTFSSNIPGNETFALKSMEYFERYLEFEGEKSSHRFEIQSAPGCLEDVGKEARFDLHEETAESFHLYGLQGRPVQFHQYKDDPQKTRRGWSKVRVLANIEAMSSNITLHEKDDTTRHNVTQTDVSTGDVPFSKDYKLKVGTVEIANDLHLEVGAVYTILVYQKGANSYDYKMITVTTPNSVHMLWLVPQYVVMTLGEVRAEVKRGFELAELYLKLKFL